VDSGSHIADVLLSNRENLASASVQQALWSLLSDVARGRNRRRPGRRPNRSPADRRIGGRGRPRDPAPLPLEAIQSVWERGPDAREPSSLQAVRRLQRAELRKRKVRKPRRQRAGLNLTRDQEILRLRREEGLTLQEIGQRMGLTRERVRQITQGLDPRAKDTRRRLVDESVRRRQERSERRRAGTAKPCVVCWWPVVRGAKFKTCSHVCAELWRVARYHLDAELYADHRRRTAKAVLREPDAHESSEVALAKKILSGNDSGPNRRFVVRGSLVQNALADIEKLRKEKGGRGLPLSR